MNSIHPRRMFSFALQPNMGCTCSSYPGGGGIVVPLVYRIFITNPEGGVYILYILYIGLYMYKAMYKTKNHDLPGVMLKKTSLLYILYIGGSPLIYALYAPVPATLHAFFFLKEKVGVLCTICTKTPQKHPLTCGYAFVHRKRYVQNMYKK